MRYLPNAPVYYVPYARMIKDVRKPYTTRVLKIGEEYAIHERETFQFKKEEVHLCVRANSFTIDVTPVSYDEVELFVKLVYPKFEIGQVIIDAYPNSSQAPIPMRVMEWGISSGEIRYRDEWSMRTGCDGGMSERRARAATKEERDHWAVR